MLLFLPGLICDERMFAPQLAAFANACAVPDYGLADSLGQMARIALEHGFTGPALPYLKETILSERSLGRGWFQPKALGTDLARNNSESRSRIACTR